MYKGENTYYWFDRFYYIHLGANFTTDYNVCGNTHYTYKVTLYPEGDGDSRIEEINTKAIIEYVGMFGGELRNVDNSGVWQFSKELWVQTSDEATGVTGSIIDGTNADDGKSNTLAKKDVDRFKKCFEKKTKTIQALPLSLMPTISGIYLPIGSKLASG